MINGLNNYLNNYGALTNAYQQISPSNPQNSGPRSAQPNTQAIGKSPNNIEPVQSGKQVVDGAKFVTGEQARIEQLLKTYDEKSLKKMGIIECATCASRTYVDGSNDPGVSFKTPTHVSPGQSLQAVIGHEMEHVGREQNQASSKGGEVISQSVSIQMSTCPECGRSYAAGGVTRTTMSIPSSETSGKLVDVKL